MASASDARLSTPPPTRTAYCSSTRSPGVVLRVWVTRAGDGDGFAGHGPGALEALGRQLGAGIELAEHDGGDRESGDDEASLGNEARRGRGIDRVAQQPGGDVVGGAVFGEGAADRVEGGISQWPASG